MHGHCLCKSLPCQGLKKNVLIIHFCHKLLFDIAYWWFKSSQALVILVTRYLTLQYCYTAIYWNLILCWNRKRMFCNLQHSQLLNIIILKFNPPVLLNLLCNIFPYCPAVGAIRRINSSKEGKCWSCHWECLYCDLSRDIWWNIAWALWKIPWASPLGFPSGSGYISLYIPPLLTIQIQYFVLYCIRIRTRGGIYGQLYPFAWRSFALGNS